MKKFILMFFAVFSVVLFNSCEENKKEIIEYKLFGYTTGATNIVFQEMNDNGNILKKRSIYELKANEYSQTFTADENATCVNVYYKAKRLSEYSYYRCYSSLFPNEENIVFLSTMLEITQEEYEFYVNQ